MRVLIALVAARGNKTASSRLFFLFSSNPVLSWWHLVPPELDFISNLKLTIASPSLEGLMLKLKLHSFGHLMWRTDSLEKTHMLGKTDSTGEGHDRGWDGWMASPTQWTWVWLNLRSWWWTGRPGMLQSMGSQRVRHDWATELSDLPIISSIMDNDYWL